MISKELLSEGSLGFRLFEGLPKFFLDTGCLCNHLSSYLTIFIMVIQVIQALKTKQKIPNLRVEPTLWLNIKDNLAENQFYTGYILFSAAKDNAI